MHDRLAEYLEQAMAQVRWRRARPELEAELRSHLLLQMEDCRAAGLAEEDAAAETVRQMGDPAEAGAALDRLHRPAPQWGLLALTLILALAGGFLRVWLTAGWAEEEIDPLRTALALCLGTACLLGAYFLDYRVLSRHGKALYGCVIVLTLCSLLLSPNINCASYYTRYVVGLYPLVYALWLCAWRGRGWSGVAASLLGGVPLVVLALMAPDIRGVLLLMAAGFVLLVSAICRDWFAVPRNQALMLVCGIALAIAGGMAFRLSTGYGQRRLLIFLHPERDALGGGYQAVAVRQAVSGARWLGEGAMEASAGGLSYEQIVPEAGRDFLLTTVICKLGWLSFLLVLAAMALLLVWMFRRCLRQKDPAGRLISLAIVLPMGLRAVGAAMLNLGFVLYSIQFPLLIGNLQSLLDMALVGVALSIFREEHLPAWHCSPAETAAPVETAEAI